MTRKQHVTVPFGKMVEYVREQGVCSVSEVAAHFYVSPATARSHLDGGVMRGELVRDEYDADGQRLHFEHWRYCENDSGPAG